MPATDVYTDLAALVRLRYQAHGFSYLPRQPVNSLLHGRKRSRLRGRGLDFDELRHYRPGDDIRTMDWRVTNRTGKPHVRVYTEERDRPVMLVVDQRMGMFFGSQRQMKSVVAAEVAALTAWRVLDVGDRVGAILFNDSQLQEMRPSRSEATVLAWLARLAAMNNALSVTTDGTSDPQALGRAIQRLARTISHDYLVVLISDFHGWDAGTADSIQQLRQHNDIICAQVSDPLERDISNASQLVVSDGRYQLEIDPQHHGLSEKFEASFQGSVARVQAELKRYDIPVIPIDTVLPASEQLQRQLGGQRTTA